MWFSKKIRKVEVISEVDVQADYFRRNFSRRDRKKRLKSEPPFVLDITILAQDQVHPDPNSTRVKNITHEALRKSLRFSFADLFRHPIVAKNHINDLNELIGSDKENISPPVQFEDIIHDNSSLQRSELILNKNRSRKTIKDRIRRSKPPVIVVDEEDHGIPHKLTLRERLFGTQSTQISKTEDHSEQDKRPMTPAASSSVYEVQETLTQRYMSGNDGYDKLVEDLDAIPFDLTVKEQKKTFQQRISDAVRSLSPSKAYCREVEETKSADQLSLTLKSRDQLELGLEVDRCNPYDVAKTINQIDRYDLSDLGEDNEPIIKADEPDGQIKISSNRESRFSAFRGNFSRRDKNSNNFTKKQPTPAPAESYTEEDEGLPYDVFETNSVFLNSNSFHNEDYYSAASSETLQDDVRKISVNQVINKKKQKFEDLEILRGSTRIDTDITLRNVDGAVDHLDSDDYGLPGRDLNASGSREAIIQTSEQQLAYEDLVLNPTAIDSNMDIQEVMNTLECSEHVKIFGQKELGENFRRLSINGMIARSKRAKSVNTPKRAVKKQEENLSYSDLRRSRLAANGNNGSNRMINTTNTERGAYGSSTNDGHFKHAFPGLRSQQPVKLDFGRISGNLEDITTQVKEGGLSSKNFKKTEGIDYNEDAPTSDRKQATLKQKETDDLKTQINRNRMKHYMYLNSI